MIRFLGGEYMLNFNYYNPANIYFGRNEEQRIGELINKWSEAKKF